MPDTKRDKSQPLFRAFAPSSALDGIASELWFLEDDGKSVGGLPKPYVELVFSLSGTHWWRAQKSATEHRYTTAWVTPVQTTTRYARATGTRRLVGVRLYPWAARAIFGQLPDGNGTPPVKLKSLIGPRANPILKRLRETADDPELCVSHLQGWLAQLAKQRFRNLRRLPSTPSPYCDVEDVAQSLFLSPRQARRWFARETGVNPKKWLRLHRLDRFLRDKELTSEGVAIADLAYSHGYVDQAHLNRDLAQLVQQTPLKLRKIRLASHPPHYLPIE